MIAEILGHGRGGHCGLDANQRGFVACGNDYYRFLQSFRAKRVCHEILDFTASLAELEPATYTVASGLFNVKQDAPEGEDAEAPEPEPAPTVDHGTGEQGVAEGEEVFGEGLRAGQELAVIEQILAG